MGLNSLSRETNYKDSLRKFFVENLSDEHDIPVTFDKLLNFPDIFQEGFRYHDDRVNKWVSIVSGGLIERSPMIIAYPAIYMCTRRDNEGYRLAQLRDKVRELLNESMTIPLYRNFYVPFQDQYMWEFITHMTIFHNGESDQLTTKEDTRFKRLSLRIQWAATI